MGDDNEPAPRRRQPRNGITGEAMEAGFRSGWEAGLSGGDRIRSGPRELNVAAQASSAHHPWWIRRGSGCWLNSQRNKPCDLLQGTGQAILSFQIHATA